MLSAMPQNAGMGGCVNDVVIFPSQAFADLADLQRDKRSIVDRVDTLRCERRMKAPALDLRCQRDGRDSGRHDQESQANFGGKIGPRSPDETHAMHLSDPYGSQSAHPVSTGNG